MTENSLSETEELVSPDELSNILENASFSNLKNEYHNLPFSLLREASIIQAKRVVHELVGHTAFKNLGIAYAIKENGPKNGIRISGRLAVLYVILQYLYASGLEHVHYGMHDLMVIIASLMAFLVVSGALFHQGYLRLPKVAKND